MKKSIRQTLVVLCGICLPLALHAQQDNQKTNDDSKYLAGAVPEVEGKVVFSKTWELPGTSQEVLFARMDSWMKARLAKNDNETSRVVFTDPALGQVAGLGNEWMVFSSTALSLDRTRIYYQLIAYCSPGKCTLDIEKVRFTYREGKENYTAEEWVTDKMALNKAQTKLVRGLAKWRRKTVDFADAMFADAGAALGIPINVTTAVPVAPAAPAVVKAQPATQQPAAAAPQSLREVQPDAIPADAINISKGRLVVTIGTDTFNMTTMTANGGGMLGELNGKRVIYTIFTPDQAHQAIDQADTYSVSFYPNDTTLPSVTMECRKMPAATPPEGAPRMYVGEIVKAYVR
jgi:hypothetical protein